MADGRTVDLTYGDCRLLLALIAQGEEFRSHPDLGLRVWNHPGPPGTTSASEPPPAPAHPLTSPAGEADGGSPGPDDPEADRTADGPPAGAGADPGATPRPGLRRRVWPMAVVALISPAATALGLLTATPADTSPSSCSTSTGVFRNRTSCRP
ncbi:hypothetical protein ACFVFS_33260 [Kitasatospora sp. NPDC057692]|uniref:hypothetical protein n=1 Tax=Kitasatospora sp. NPDC057692 TaxID=3346215 RepID=UPI0036B3CC7C